MVAVASRDRGARGGVRGRAAGSPRAHGSYEELLADDDVEAVYVPLPNSMHLPWSERALEAGKHVLCEKPLSRRAADVEAAFDVAERAGRLLMEAFMWRYHPQTERLVRLVRDGRDRRGCASCARRSASRWRRASQRALVGRARGRGADGRRLLLRERAAAAGRRARAGRPPSRSTGGEGVDARLAGVLRFDGDVLGTFDCGFDVAARARRIEVVGDEGTIVSPTRGTAGRRDLRMLRAGAEPERDPGRGRQPVRARARRLRRARSARAASRGSAAPTRSARPARSRRSTRPPRP